MSFNSDVLSSAGVDVSRETIDRLAIYCDLLVRWQKRINLVGPSTLTDIGRRHFADCLQMASLTRQTEIIADLGSGAGFPGLILALVLAEREGGDVHLIESAGKKCAFLREVVRETGLRGSTVSVEVHHGRIEDVLPGLDDVSLITARALAPLDTLLHLTGSSLSGQCRALFQKGERYGEEINAAQQKWRFDHLLHASKVDRGSVIIEVSNVSWNGAER